MVFISVLTFELFEFIWPRATVSLSDLRYSFHSVRCRLFASRNRLIRWARAILLRTLSFRHAARFSPFSSNLLCLRHFSLQANNMRMPFLSFHR